jgi:hypothetical protein
LTSAPLEELLRVIQQTQVDLERNRLALVEALRRATREVEEMRMDDAKPR